MIGSFWNLCRATCPAMPVDKLHSEYRSTYRWHEYTGPRQDVVRKAPMQNGIPPSGGTTEIVDIKPPKEDEFVTDSVSKQEPVMPRRKKYPDLAYRHHEFLVNDGVTENKGIDSRARSEERFGPNWRPSRRSKSEGPRRSGKAKEPELEIDPGERRRESDPDCDNMGRENGLLRKAISKISTEYRRQFAWPPGYSSKDEIDGAPRKSQSMGALKANANAMVHKKRIDVHNKDASELEPLVDDRANQEKAREELNSEYKKQFRPFTQYQYISGRFSSKKRTSAIRETENVHKDFSDADLMDNDASWYREVVELRKKAGEYKHRGWGSELAPERLSDIYNKQVELWDQVSRRSSLSALSLASHMTKSYTKEDKEEDNNRKSSPTKAYRNAENNARMIRDIIRHHLERTTGGSEFDGLILSPTREKLEPTIPKKDEDSRGSQKNSPKKSSPLKTSSKRGSQKGKEVRSQSVGPTSENKEKQSPKRQSRSTVKGGRKSTSNTPSNKRPRPSSEQPKSEQTPTEMKKNQENDQLDSLEYEPVIKSPPEPTRVKSPEQIIMRSPDPVNWTVPLDTGKTFTVTQNVRDGDPGSRPQSEVKAWTPPEVPPPVAQSAPPTLAEGQASLS
ncbi:nuclear protein MDM1 isoform X9 [Anthonomus grandis grandis]|uniref:nuclear protein MDM1 isoform X9 n=1 Tax=Anthonomus grandis grandis TaxID=2921223 RepID=UPI0021664718|nr:nuclear protein MDM1 isoform X9 [Anthonomus grandis grandis]